MLLKRGNWMKIVICIFCRILDISIAQLLAKGVRSMRAPFFALIRHNKSLLYLFCCKSPTHFRNFICKNTNYQRKIAIFAE